MNIFQRALESFKAKSYDVLYYNSPYDDYSGTPRRWSKYQFLQANEISLYTNRALAKRAEKVSEVEFTLKNRKSDKEIEDHWVLDLLRKPNQFQTGLQFWGLYQKYRDIIGAAYIWKEPSNNPADFQSKGKIGALHLLRSDCVSHIYGEDGMIAGFRYTPQNGKPTEFKPEEIIYSYTPDPIRPTEPISLLAAGIRTIDTEDQLSKYHANVIRNGGNIGTVFKFKTPNISKQQLTDLKQSYDDQFANARNGGKPLFLGGDADILKLNMSPAELSYMEGKKLILDDITIMTGVPKAILAVTSGETFANAEAAIDIFLRETIKPLLTDLVTTLDWSLVPDDLDLEFKDPTPENVELKLKRIENGFRNSYLTINEARDMEGYEPIDGGDEILVDIKMIPLSKAGEQTTVDPNANPNDPNNNNDQNGGSNGDSNLDSGNSKGFKGPHPLRDDYVREKYGQVMMKRMDRNEEKVLEAIKRYFTGQRTRLINHIEGARTFRRKDIIDEAFNFTVEANLAKGTILPLIKEILKHSGNDAKEMAGSTRPFVLTSKMESYLDLRANIFSNQITETTFDTLKHQFTESLDKGETRQQLVKRIKDTYDGYDDNRAKLIARTEVHGATQTGTMEGYVQAGVKTKIWVTVGDLRVRDTHRAVDGEEVPIDMVFSNGLRFPGDPEAPADEVCNCRCSI